MVLGMPWLTGRVITVALPPWKLVEHIPVVKKHAEDKMMSLFRRF
jgi:hypothetical protein